MIGQSAMNNLNDRKRAEVPDDLRLPRQFMPEERVAILLFFAVDKLYDYAVPAKMMVTVGDIVQVPQYRCHGLAILTVCSHQMAF